MSDSRQPPTKAGDLNANVVPSADALVRDAVIKCQNGVRLARVKASSMVAPRIMRLSPDMLRMTYFGGGTNCIIPVRDKAKVIDVSEIIEVRHGWNSDNFGKQLKNKQTFGDKFPVGHESGGARTRLQEQNCFSVVFRHPQFLQKSIDLYAATKEEAQCFVTTLNHLIKVRRDQRNYFDENEWLARNFDHADVNKDGVLTFRELWDLLKSLELEVTEGYCAKMFNTVVAAHTPESHTDPFLCLPMHMKQGDVALDKEGFVAFFDLLTHRPPLEEIMRRFAPDASTPVLLTAAALAKFMREEQGVRHACLTQPITTQWVNMTDKQCAELIAIYEPDECRKQAQMIGINGFRRLLLSKEWGDIMSDEYRSAQQDMTLPLCSYFINASHNTYLTGNQLRGEASVEGYVHALACGARVLELDIWDGPDNSPIIYHGHTLVKALALSDACKAINGTAFKTSPYPVILSIENHCTEQQQVRMAEIFIECFGERLYSHGQQQSLSPASLMYRILIKAKMLTDEEDVSSDDGEESTPSRKKKHGHQIAPEWSRIVGLPATSLHHLTADADSRRARVLAHASRA